MNNISKSSEEVIQNVLNAIQPLEELGGHLLPEYILVMDRIVQEAIKRGNVARFTLAQENAKAVALGMKPPHEFPLIWE